MLVEIQSKGVLYTGNIYYKLMLPDPYFLEEYNYFKWDLMRGILLLTQRLLNIGCHFEQISLPYELYIFSVVYLWVAAPLVLCENQISWSHFFFCFVRFVKIETAVGQKWQMFSSSGLKNVNFKLPPL